MTVARANVDIGALDEILQRTLVAHVRLSEHALALWQHDPGLIRVQLGQFRCRRVRGPDQPRQEMESDVLSLRDRFALHVFGAGLRDRDVGEGTDRTAAE